jgi:hypothetical protein
LIVNLNAKIKTNLFILPIDKLNVIVYTYIIKNREETNMYVIQYFTRGNGFKSGSWLPCAIGGVPRRYPTLEQAKTAFNGLNRLDRIDKRIAEEYTVIRYKAVTI